MDVEDWRYSIVAWVTDQDQDGLEDKNVAAEDKDTEDRDAEDKDSENNKEDNLRVEDNVDLEIVLGLDLEFQESLVS
jgi:hypothetical protein